MQKILHSICIPYIPIYAIHTLLYDFQNRSSSSQFEWNEDENQ